ncbi:VOC family protein [Pedobacter sp. SYP-B3415]|uniref:VOC family protein n=1 Tax=Pedobacter sp. SYP-B3415 TaxID=2496641 RepID=UPI00101BD117|nr:VOC family protein [Pedobacter sp. SYP-B3415]
MRKITPHLWFDNNAVEATQFYTTLFPGSEITNISTIRDTPSGDCDIVSFKLWGQPFMAISAGPFFELNPSVSFMVNFDPLFFGPGADAKTVAQAKLEAVWERLAEGGKVLMPLDQYPFSERYGWIQDKYGVSWQLILTDPAGDKRPAIIPSLMFTGGNAGRAEEAIDFYVAVFNDGKRGETHRYGPGQQPDIEGSLTYADFRIEGAWFAAMDSRQELNFGFNEAVSFIVNCDTQEEIDYYWSKLSAEPAAEQCGWLKDRFGLSWQVNPSRMDEMLKDPDPERVKRVTQAFLGMKKFDIAQLEKAFAGV